MLERAQLSHSVFPNCKLRNEKAATFSFGTQLRNSDDDTKILLALKLHTASAWHTQLAHFSALPLSFWAADSLSIVLCRLTTEKKEGKLPGPSQLARCSLLAACVQSIAEYSACVYNCARSSTTE